MDRGRGLRLRGARLADGMWVACGCIIFSMPQFSGSSVFVPAESGLTAMAPLAVSVVVGLAMGAVGDGWARGDQWPRSMGALLACTALVTTGELAFFSMRMRTGLSPANRQEMLPGIVLAQAVRVAAVATWVWCGRISRSSLADDPPNVRVPVVLFASGVLWRLSMVLLPMTELNTQPMTLELVSWLGSLLWSLACVLAIRSTATGPRVFCASVSALLCGILVWNVVGRIFPWAPLGQSLPTALPLAVSVILPVVEIVRRRGIGSPARPQDILFGGCRRTCEDEMADKLESLEGRGALTSREHEITMLTMTGLSASEIAGRLGITISTVGSYRLRAYHKLGVESRSELVALVDGTCRLHEGADQADGSRRTGRVFSTCLVLRWVIVVLALVLPPAVEAMWGGPWVATRLAVASALVADGFRRYITGDCDVTNRLGMLPGVCSASLVGVGGAAELCIAAGRVFAVGTTLSAGLPIAGVFSWVVLCLFDDGLLDQGGTCAIELTSGLALALFSSAVLPDPSFPVLSAWAFLVVGTGFFVVAHRSLLDSIKEGKPVRGDGRTKAYLVGRGLGDLQSDVLLLTARGYPVSSVAKMACVSVATVYSYRRRGYKSLCVHSRAELVELLRSKAGLDV